MIIDISQPIARGIAVFPGDAAFSAKQTFKISEQCPVNVSAVTMSTHCGTHADAPLHFEANGLPVGGLNLEAFLGPCRVIDARAQTLLCEPQIIEGLLKNAPPRILLRLMDRIDPNEWPQGFRAVAPQTMDLLGRRGTRLIGIDSPSVDPEISKDLPSHKMASRFNIRILENLVLHHVDPGDYELIALPLRLEHLDASPVRAVLRRN